MKQVMQLLHENKTVLMMKDFNTTTNFSIKDVSSGNLDLKEKQSSNASLLVMNPVASGDNVATRLNSTHRLKEEMPALVACCEGKELQINEDLVRSGLSAISVKHDGVVECVSMSRAYERLQVPPCLVKHRNSFRCLQRPDLKRVPYLRRMTPDELETLFRGYAADIQANKEHAQNNDNKKEVLKPTQPDAISRAKDTKMKINLDDAEGIGVTGLHVILETRSGAEDVPAGMRLHGARARLYTSVLAGAKAGDQLDDIVTTEEYDTKVPEDIPEDEVQLHEELQIILPPRCDDVAADSNTTNFSTDTFS